MELDKFIDYIRVLGFEDSRMNGSSTPDLSGKFYFDNSDFNTIYIEIEAREDTRLGYDEYYYRVTFWQNMTPVYNYDLRYMDGVNEVINIMDKFFSYYTGRFNSLSTIEHRYNSLKAALLRSIEREKKIRNILGEEKLGI